MPEWRRSDFAPRCFEERCTINEGEPESLSLKAKLGLDSKMKGKRRQI
jgi:hypothetical protein